MIDIEIAEFNTIEHSLQMANSATLTLHDVYRLCHQ